MSSRAHPSRELRYMQQDCEMTLREGIEEYYTQIDDLITTDNASVETAQMFRYHDLCHVVFGCDTSIAGEMMADTWALAGTSVKFMEYMQYFNVQESQDILAAFLTRQAVKDAVGAIPLMPKAWWRSRKMTQKWPYRDNEQYLDMPLSELRDAFNIQVVRVAQA